MVPTTLLCPRTHDNQYQKINFAILVCVFFFNTPPVLVLEVVLEVVLEKFQFVVVVVVIPTFIIISSSDDEDSSLEVIVHTTSLV